MQPRRSKLEANESFPRFPGFQFQVKGKIENPEMDIFFLKAHRKVKLFFF